MAWTAKLSLNSCQIGVNKYDAIVKACFQCLFKMEIEFFGDNKVVVEPTDSLLTASLAAGIPHYHACGGIARCSTCRVLVLEGEQNLSPPTRAETKLKLKIGLPAEVRLACQTKLMSGYVRVERLLKDAKDIERIIEIDERKPGKFKLRPLGMEKELVLFFLDIRNFTRFVQFRPPFDVIFTLQKLFSLFQDIITREHGEVIQIVGDEIYAAFGITGRGKLAADAAIAAGLKSLQAVEEFNNTYKKVLHENIQIGIGIHSGNVVVGELRLAGKRHLSTVGLAVNIASRIQEHTKKINNSFLVSQQVIEASTLSVNSEPMYLQLQGVTSLTPVFLLGKPYVTF